MSITDELRKSFDQCTYKAGVAPNEFDTVWITKICALSMLDDIDAAFEAGHSRAVEYGKEIGRGTCKPREVRSRFSKTQERVTYYCECGHELGGHMTAELPFPHTYNENELPNFCPNCGRKVVDE